MELKSCLFLATCLISVCTCSFTGITKYDTFEVPSDAWQIHVINNSYSGQTLMTCGSRCNAVANCGGFHWDLQECSLLDWGLVNPYDLNGTVNDDAIYIDEKG
jgi:hypothetical protein